jgi:transposase
MAGDPPEAVSLSQVWQKTLGAVPKQVTEMIRNWRIEILNYFFEHLTNGATEGFNAKIKLIIRTTYGFSNFQHPRARDPA